MSLGEINNSTSLAWLLVMRRLIRFSLLVLGVLAINGCGQWHGNSVSLPTPQHLQTFCHLAEDATQQLQMQPVASTYAVNSPSRASANSPDFSHLTQACSGAIRLLVDWGWWTEQQLLGSVEDLTSLTQALVEWWLSADGHYQGLTSDPWLSQRLAFSYQSATTKPKDKALQAWLDQQVVAKNISGYNLFQQSLLPEFNPQTSLFYGHSDIPHLRQLLALMKQQQLLAKVQLVPKYSVFVYLPEWGGADYRVEKTAGGTLLARPLEYDVYLDFIHAEDRQQFLGMVQTFAKRSEHATTDQLTGSWWQPFIATPAAAEGFFQVEHLQLSSADWQARMVVLPEQMVATPIPAEFNPQRSPLWVNPAFYRYLTGQDFE